MGLQADPEVVVDAPVSCWLGWVEPALEGLGEDALEVNFVFGWGLLDGLGAVPGGVVLIEPGGAVQPAVPFGAVVGEGA